MQLTRPQLAVIFSSWVHFRFSLAKCLWQYFRFFLIRLGPYLVLNLFWFLSRAQHLCANTDCIQMFLSVHACVCFFLDGIGSSLVSQPTPARIAISVSRTAWYWKRSAWGWLGLACETSSSLGHCVVAYVPAETCSGVFTSSYLTSFPSILLILLHPSSSSTIYIIY